MLPIYDKTIHNNRLFFNFCFSLNRLITFLALG
jgi:hypothetical protein